MWTYPYRIVAHRGGGTLAPENTIAGLRAGLERGFRAVEFDVMLSADHVPVLMHDPAFGRTVPGVGNVAETSAKLLATMDAGGWFSPAFSGEPVPRFVEAIDFCFANRIWMNVEIKPAPGHAVETGRIATATLQRALAALGAQAAAGRDEPDAMVPLISSFSHEALLAAREVAPEIPRAHLFSAVPEDWRERMRAIDAVALHTSHAKLTAELAKEIRDAGYALFCYTVNEPERARELFSWGVDAFCTDRIDVIGPDFA
jgi:glycerophosphoryl diester phosphodiesterase